MGQRALSQRSGTSRDAGWAAGEREAIIAAENPNGDEASPTAAATRRIGVLVTKRPMIGRDRALTQV